MWKHQLLGSRQGERKALSRIFAQSSAEAAWHHNWRRSQAQFLLFAVPKAWGGASRMVGSGPRVYPWPVSKEPPSPCFAAGCSWICFLLLAWWPWAVYLHLCRMKHIIPASKNYCEDPVGRANRAQRGELSPPLLHRAPAGQSPGLPAPLHMVLVPPCGQFSGLSLQEVLDKAHAPPGPPTPHVLFSCIA